MSANIGNHPQKTCTYKRNKSTISPPGPGEKICTQDQAIKNKGGGSGLCQGSCSELNSCARALLVGLCRHIVILKRLKEGFPGEAKLAIPRVYIHELDLELLTYFELFLQVVDLFVAHLADMQ